MRQTDNTMTTPMPLDISVIICAHNPRADYLDRVLSGLRLQDLSQDRWELLLIDNGSADPLAGRFDISWHSAGRHVAEPRLGLTPARVTGIRESSGQLLVFVDDDNVLRPDYLTAALEIEMRHPTLGAWSGRLVPDFEVEPPAEIVPYLGKLCLRDFRGERWSNQDYGADSPYGAGMCVRREVAMRYASRVSSDQGRLALDRSGDGLGTMGDIDLAMTGLEIGLGCGIFDSLELTHLIPARRLTLDFLVRLIRDATASELVYRRIRNLPEPSEGSGIDRLVSWYKYVRASPIDRQFERAKREGRNRGLAMLEKLTQGLSL